MEDGAEVWGRKEGALVTGGRVRDIARMMSRPVASHSHATNGRSRMVGHAALLATAAACAGQPRAEPAPARVSEQAGGEPLDDAAQFGAGKEVTFAEFKAAAEHYQVGVIPGSQTALRDAAGAYAAYLAAFHRHLHIQYVHRFIATLSLEDAETNEPSLITKVEVVIEPDGSLNRLGVVRSSGSVRFDFGVFNAVHRGAPYPPPPKAIHSVDGRTYLRWALHRNSSQCGTWNAEPFILKYVMVSEPVEP